ncbi:uncharacterized protein LOC104903750 [Beta vulgaris subsp. vulgaris]|uniref:uncharacterized protein LOC104903750 n=1 Tax=Beta vulgaris subsp. vulgaris TaxID=3555 RepID=UPI0020368291|nr:uncharacterized protein LOC104903750 [Beta vulgaris subsp. vulgaris]
MIRHNLDVMHIEKNVFDNVFHTIMDVKGKTKDNLKARKDLVLFCKRRKLEVREDSISVPTAPFVLSMEKRKALCEWLLCLKLSDSYASDLGKCVDTKEYRLFGLKSHDCHVFMQRLLHVAFKDLLPPNVWNALTELSQFFRDICSTSLQLTDMIRLENNIAEILCKLEKIFPPTFFNCMEHLPVHLPYEARVGGPVQYRWMYPFERFLYHLKQKVGSKARVEASICNASLTEEISNFCSHYFEEHITTRVSNLGLNSRDDEEPKDSKLPEIFTCNDGYSASQGQLVYLDDKDYDIGHKYILGNCAILGDFEQYDLLIVKIPKLYL